MISNVSFGARYNVKLPELNEQINFVQREIVVTQRDGTESIYKVAERANYNDPNKNSGLPLVNQVSIKGDEYILTELSEKLGRHDGNVKSKITINKDNSISVDTKIPRNKVYNALANCFSALNETLDGNLVGGRERACNIFEKLKSEFLKEVPNELKAENIDLSAV